MKVKELIEKLQKVDPEWHVEQTGSTGSIYVSEHNREQGRETGDRYGWLFLDERPLKLLTTRK